MTNYVTQAIKETIAQSALFDKYATLTSADRDLINESVNEILTFRAGGSVATFNENTANYGFNFNDFKQATTIIYKAALAVIKVCGAGGSNMAADSETAKEARESYYYGNYIHAFLLFVRTESEYETDDNGNRVKGDDGNDKLVALDEAGKAERQRRIAEIEAAMAAINAGETDPEYFFELMTAYDDGYASYDEHYADGYYFNRSEGYTQNFPIENVFETLAGVDINEAAKIEYEDGVCFVLRSSLADGAYSDTDESWCFGDFYELTANDFFADLIKKSAKEVDVRDSYDKLQFTKIPYMSENYVARFGG